MNILNYLKSNAQRTESKFNECKETMATDFLYYFKWSGEETYKIGFMHKLYVRLIGQCENMESEGADNDTIKTYVKEEIERHQQFLSRPYNVRSESTGEMHRETSIWEYQVTLEFVSILTSITRA